MRKHLADLKEQRKRFRAIFVRYGKKAGWKGRTAETILLRDIYEIESNSKVTDHLWFNVTKEFSNLDLHEGDVIEFDARSTAYTKGYVNRLGAIDQRKRDYKLSHPTKVKKLQP
ncbi:MAG TPA: hypothetical protein VEB86_13125 [Chryseosolibacter sp.]|nr:hypothetical protein [Chryseosolibacter sp.]